MKGCRDCVVGIDGCRAGWFSIVLSSGKMWNIKVFSNIGEAWESLCHAKAILIDIPIGLHNKGTGGRECDIQARQILGSPRSSSVFTPPVRPALDCKTREKASACNYRLTGKRVGVQTG